MPPPGPAGCTSWTPGGAMGIKLRSLHRSKRTTWKDPRRRKTKSEAQSCHGRFLPDSWDQRVDPASGKAAT